MKRKIVHLVDDESVIHDIFKKIFNAAEYELRISENKSQAKTNHSADVDVVIMDQMIPGSSGLDIFKELKKDDPEIKAIFLTAFGTIEAAIEAIKHGAAGLSAKAVQQHRAEAQSRPRHQGKEAEPGKYPIKKNTRRQVFV